jgi:hypothetical protein
MGIGNAIVRPLLRSSVGAGIHELALLSFRGRRTGRRYTVPVAYHELDGEPLILTSSGWKANLRAGADVEFLHEGRRVPMRAELIEEARRWDASTRRSSSGTGSNTRSRPGSAWRWKATGSRRARRSPGPWAAGGPVVRLHPVGR